MHLKFKETVEYDIDFEKIKQDTIVVAMWDLPQSIYWGLVPGFVTAFGGAYKDTLFEPFEPLKFFRSPIICFLWYIIVHRMFMKEPVILKLGLSSMMERITVESYKAVWKPEPGKFKSCKCVSNKCVLEKDRGWFIDRMKGGSRKIDGQN